MSSKDKIFLLLCGIFFASLIMANIIGISKFWSFFGIMVPIGIIPYPITFLATDLISELYGKKKASYVVLVGFLLNIFLLLVLFVADTVEAHPDWAAITLENEPEKINTFDHVYSYMNRGTIASMIAYLTAQFFDVRIFHWIKEKTKGRYLWLRNNGSTMLSQLIDTTAVITITFIGTVDMATLAVFIFNAYLFKLFVAATDTPFFYLGVRLFKKYVKD